MVTQLLILLRSARTIAYSTTKVEHLLSVRRHNTNATDGTDFSIIFLEAQGDNRKNELLQFSIYHLQ